MPIDRNLRRLGEPCVRRRGAFAALRGALVVSLLGLLPIAAAADDWPQFRGFNASGVSTADRPLPVEFSLDQNLLWSADIGDGIGSPVIVDNRVYVTGMIEEKKFAAFAFDADTGRKLWQREFEVDELPRITPPNSHASATPAADGERVYIHFSTLGLIALDARSGSILWEHPLPRPAYLMDWGSGTSPVLYDGMVIFNQDDDLAPALYAVDAATGELRWKTERNDMLAGYAVPVICETDGQVDLVVSGTGKLVGYDPQTGRQRWQCRSLLRTMMTSPVVKDGVIYISVQSYGDETRTLKYALMEWLDTNQDGKLARDEIPKEFHKRFDESDRNGDGVLDGEEIDSAFQSADNIVGGGNTIQAVRGGGQGDVTETHVLWNIKNRSPSNLSSPLVVGDQLFVVKKGGLSSSFDISDGSKHWELRRINNIGDYYSSPVAGDGKIYVAGENGFVMVLEQGPQLKVLAKNDIGQSCLATPAIAGGRIFVRGRQSLFCFGK